MVAAICLDGTPAAETDGERWTREALERLRAGAYGLRAWLRFISESRERAQMTRQQRPVLATQADRWSAAGAGASVACAWGLRRRCGTRPAEAAAWSAIVAGMLRWHLGMLEGPRGEPHSMLDVADALSLTRIWAVPIVVPAGRHRRLFAAIVALGACSDGLDGAVARRRGPTRLGRDLDAVADLLFLSAAVRGAARAELVGPYAARALLARQGLVALATAVHYFAVGRPPSRRALGATRWVSPLVTAGILAGAAGHRRIGNTLLACTALAAGARHLVAVGSEPA
jgi:phosphatidylglycerophosphate synthase